MTRLLLALVSSLCLTGCALFRDPMTVPFDLKIRPQVEVDFQTSSGLDFNWNAALIAAVAIGLVYLLSNRLKKKVC